MNPEELKHIALFNVLKKNKSAQQSALRLGKTKDWKVLQSFVAEVKQELLEATLSVDNIDDLRRYKNVIRGMESIVKLPKFVNDIKEITKEDKASKKEAEKEAKRRKYNPGAFIRGIVKRGDSK